MQARAPPQQAQLEQLPAPRPMGANRGRPTNAQATCLQLFDKHAIEDDSRCATCLLCVSEGWVTTRPHDHRRSSLNAFRRAEGFGCLGPEPDRVGSANPVRQMRESRGAPSRYQPEPFAIRSHGGRDYNQRCNAMMRRYGHWCYCCGVTLGVRSTEGRLARAHDDDDGVHVAQIGHVRAASKSGPAMIQNQMPLCGPCNVSMGPAADGFQWAIDENKKARHGQDATTLCEDVTRRHAFVTAHANFKRWWILWSGSNVGNLFS